MDHPSKIIFSDWLSVRAVILTVSGNAGNSVVLLALLATTGNDTHDAKDNKVFVFESELTLM
jgi:hypothetical protein